MIGPDPTLRRTATIFRTETSGRRPARRMRGRIALLIAGAALASGAISFAYAQNNAPAFTPPPAGNATSPTVPCLPAGKDLVMPPEIDASDSVLKGNISWRKSFSACPRLPQGTRIARSNWCASTGRGCHCRLQTICSIRCPDRPCGRASETSCSSPSSTL